MIYKIFMAIIFAALAIVGIMFAFYFFTLANIFAKEFFIMIGILAVIVLIKYLTRKKRSEYLD